MFSAFTRFFAMLGIGLALGFSASAQSTNSIDSPTCMLSSETSFLDSGTNRNYYSHELYIWTWYAYGLEGASDFPRWNNWQYAFSSCFEKEANGKCGWKPHRKTVKELNRNRTDNRNKNPLKKVFTDRPPPEAVKFAMRSLGTCFGDDPALPTLADVGLVEGDFDMDACFDLARAIQNYEYYPQGLPPEIVNYETWAKALEHYLTPWGEETPVKACAVVPEPGLAFLLAYPERQEQKRQADEQARIAYANRPIAERIKGLDAYRMAYSLVYRTKSGEHSPTRPLPDGAIEWSDDYYTKVRNGEAEPEIPDAVSVWAVEQPLDKFEPVEDPFEARRRLSPREIDGDVWGNYVESRMAKMAPNEQLVSLVDVDSCATLMGVVRSDLRNGISRPSTPGEVEYYRLVRAAPDGMTWDLCSATPSGIFLSAKKRYEEKLRKEAYAAANPAPPSEWDQILQGLSDYANTPNSSSNSPTSRPTTRCYNTGTTESGQTERVCFSN